MRIFGWILIILGSLACVLATMTGVTAGISHSPSQGVGAIAAAIAGVAMLFGGIRLLEVNLRTWQ
jgi:hypothetical protein